ncbi:hypothetical protein [Psychroserpens sp. MEBiC05023]
MRCVLPLLIFLFAIHSFAQDRYQIIYNYNNDVVNYYKLDKENKIVDTLTKPKIRRNSIVELKVLNVNPFALELQTNFETENIKLNENGFNFSSLINDINSLSSSDLKLNVKLSDTDDTDDEGGDEVIATKTRGDDLRTKISSFTETNADISAIRSTLISNLMNPNISKDEIIQHVIEAAKQSANDDMRYNPEENFYLFLADLENHIQQEEQSITNDIEQLELQIASNAISEQNPNSGALQRLNYNMNSLKSLSINLEDSANRMVTSVGEIKSLYALLEASEFEKTYDHLLESDRVTIELKFMQSEFSRNQSKTRSKEMIKERSIKVFSKGGFKINSSIALTLNNFSSNSSDYFITDQVVREDKHDYFVPNLSTMINFYPYAGENFNIGGSFGLSIPISSTDQVSGVNFLLGPSLFFGTKNRLSLTGGIAYGPVKRLSKGLEVGETTTTTDVTTITKNVYDFGYFFGISFSLFDIN